MWVLTKANTEERFYLIPEQPKYTVGRVGADLSLDDKSISRTHAHFHVTSDTLAVEDVGSKYGTFRNEGIASKKDVAKNTRIQLSDGDRIQFGVLENLWRVSQRPLASMSSALPRDQTQHFEQSLHALGGRVLSSWDASCTHLTMNEVTVTVKVLYALLQQIPIVSCDFWRDFLYVARRGSGVPLPEAKNYMPHRCEELLQTHDVDLGARPERKRLFAGTTFVFMNRKHLEIYAPIVQKAGGACKDLNSGVQKPFLLKTNVVVVQYVSSTESEGSQIISSISDYLESHSRRLIPEYEIGLAIVHCSMAKYCNPAYKMLADLLPPSSSVASPAKGLNNSANALFIENTNSPIKQSQNSGASTDVLVPETEQSNAGGTPTASEPVEDKNGDDNDCEMSNMCVTESAAKEDGQNKRSRDLVDDGSEDNEDLFHFTKKPHMDSVGNNGNEEILPPPPPPPPAVEVPKPLPDQFGFFGKSQVGSRRSYDTAQSSENQETEQANPRKRQRISVLSDGDDGDELFGFGGASAAKSSRMENDGGNGSDGGLFAFTKGKTSSVDDDEDEGDELDPTQTFVPKAQSKAVVTAKPFPKPKLLPQEVNTAGWLSCSLHKMELKSEPKTDEEAAAEQCEPKTDAEVEQQNNAADSSVAVIKKEEDVADEQTALWVNSLKGGFHVRQSSVSTLSRSRDVSSHNLANFNNAGVPEGTNFKAFTKTSNPHPQQKVITTIRAASFPLRLR